MPATASRPSSRAATASSSVVFVATIALNPTADAASATDSPTLTGLSAREDSDYDVQVSHFKPIAVSDTGTGLAPGDLEHIFERFYRAPGQPRRAPGSGIGLTIARNIAQAHGGDVAAASPGPGRGAAFTLTLPAWPG